MFRIDFRRDSKRIIYCKYFAISSSLEMVFETIGWHAESVEVVRVYGTLNHLNEMCRRSAVGHKQLKTRIIRSVSFHVFFFAVSQGEKLFRPRILCSFCHSHLFFVRWERENFRLDSDFVFFLSSFGILIFNGSKWSECISFNAED